MTMWLRNGCTLQDKRCNPHVFLTNPKSTVATQNRANNADNANDTPPRPPQVQRPRRTPENLDNVVTAAEERSGDGPYETLNENRGDVAVDGFWSNRRTCIFDIRLTDTECRTTRNQDPEKVLNKCEKLKKDKHLRACLQNRRDFTPLVYSVDGMAGRETKQAERRMASLLAGKWDRDYSEMVAYVRARMAIAVMVQANTLLIRGTHQRQRPRPFIHSGAAMNGWRTFPRNI